MLNWSIKTRVILLAIMPTFLVTVFLGGFFVFKRYADIERTLDMEGRMLLKQLVASSRYGLTLGDKPYLNKSLGFFINSDNIIVLAIYDDQGNLLASAGKTAEVVLPTSILRDVVEHSENQRTYISPVYRSKQKFLSASRTDAYQQEPPLGWIYVQLTHNNAWLDEYRMFINYLLIALLSLGVSGLLAIHLSRRLTQPICKMVAAINRMKQGDLTVRVPENAQAELKELQQGLNELSEALQKSRLGMQHDIEQATQDLRDTLETLEVQNIELHLARKKASEHSQNKSVFMAKMTHELRTPVNGIIGFARLLQDSPLYPHQSEYVETIERSSHHLLSIINNMLDLSKLEAGKLNIDQVPLSIRQCTEEVLDMLAPSAYDKKIELILDVNPKVPLRLLGDPLHYKQIITNLVSNAIKFTESGSIIIRILTNKETTKTTQLQVSVEDSGLGMNPKEQDNLFKTFGQATPLIQQQYGGTGLGLIICKQLVNLMGGEIGFTSESGVGSTFWFTILCDKLPTNFHAAIEYKRLMGLKVFLYDPHPVNRQALNSLLTSWNMDVVIFDEHAALMQALQGDTAAIDALFLGVSAEAADLPTLKSEIKTCKRLYKGVMLVLVNNRDQFFMNELVSAGASACLDKPIHEQKLYQLLCQVLLQAGAIESYDRSVLSSEEHAIENVPRGSALIVDDTAINLKLLSILLTRAGFEVETATDGQQALEHVYDNQYDIIFLDLQMPNLDGFEAAEAIRQYEKKHTHRVPIIAVSAFNRSECQTRLDSAGFDDFLSKPVSEESLNAILQRWSDKTDEVDHGLIKKKESDMSEKQPVLIDLELGKQLAGGNQTLAIELMSMLLGQLPTDLQAMEQALDQKDYTELKRLVHALYGGSCYCGLPLLKETTKALENLLIAEAFDDATQAFQRLQDVIAKTLSAFAALSHS